MNQLVALSAETIMRRALDGHFYEATHCPRRMATVIIDNAKSRDFVPDYTKDTRDMRLFKTAEEQAIKAAATRAEILPEVMRLRAMGLSDERISEQIGTSASRVRRTRQEAGLK